MSILGEDSTSNAVIFSQPIGFFEGTALTTSFFICKGLFIFFVLQSNLFNSLDEIILVSFTEDDRSSPSNLLSVKKKKESESSNYCIAVSFLL